MLAIMKSLRPAWKWAIAAAGALVVASAIVVATLVMQQARDQRFLDALRADTTTTVGELPDEQLLVSRERDCEDIARGWTVDDAMDAAEKNWPGVANDSITEQEHYDNVRALFNAASVAC